MEKLIVRSVNVAQRNLLRKVSQKQTRMKRIEENPIMPIKDFLCYILNLAGLKRGIDFKVFQDHLFIVKSPIRGKVISILKEIYPEYNFYWDNPMVLRWI